MSRKASTDYQTLVEEKLEVGHFFDMLHTIQYSQKWIKVQYNTMQICLYLNNVDYPEQEL